MHCGDRYYSFIIRLFVVITHPSLPLFLSGLILHSVPVSLYTFDATLLFSFAPSLHNCSPAVTRSFMGCLLNRRSITASPLSPVSSSLPPLVHRGIRVQLFPPFHSSVAWFRSSGCVMHACVCVYARAHTQIHTDSPVCLITPFLFLVFHSCTQKQRRVFSHTAVRTLT